MFTCVYAFMAVQLDNQLVCSSLGKTTSLIPSTQLPCIALVGLELTDTVCLRIYSGNKPSIGVCRPVCLPRCGLWVCLHHQPMCAWGPAGVCLTSGLCGCGFA